MSECNHKFEGWNEDDIEVCVICEKPTAEIAHALQQQLDDCTAENERLAKAWEKIQKRERETDKEMDGLRTEANELVDALRGEVSVLESENKDLRAACEQKQEIINSFALVDKVRRDQVEELRAENARLREAAQEVFDALMKQQHAQTPVLPWPELAPHANRLRDVLGGDDE